MYDEWQEPAPLVSRRNGFMDSSRDSPELTQAYHISFCTFTSFFNNASCNGKLVSDQWSGDQWFFFIPYPLLVFGRTKVATATATTVVHVVDMMYEP